MNTHRFVNILAICCAMLCLSACTNTKVYDDPIPVMTNLSVAPEDRWSAIRQAEERFRSDPRRIAALNQMLYDRGYPDDHRRYAIDQLIAHNEEEFRAQAANRIVLIHNTDTLNYLFTQATKRNWDFSAAIVRSWVRPAKGVPDKERAEYAALKKLNPVKDVQQAVYDVFASDGDALPADQRSAAWELLNRIAPPEQLQKMLLETPDRTPLIIDLKAAARDLHVTPVNREGIVWLFYLRDPARRQWWERATKAVAALSVQQRLGLELRHIPAILAADANTLASDRTALLARVTPRIEPGEHSLLSPTYDGQDKEYPQRLHNWSDKLTWGDLVVLDQITAALRDPAVIAALFEQGDVNIKDDSTEYGGMLNATRDAGTLRPTATGFPPGKREHRLKYISSPALFESLYTGLAHYHFHAQEYRNSAYAGPGRGDMEFAQRNNFNCVVFTFTDKTKLNADYYCRNGIVIDLGTLRR